jgi:hypothetical protein
MCKFSLLFFVFILSTKIWERVLNLNEINYNGYITIKAYSTLKGFFTSSKFSLVYSLVTCGAIFLFYPWRSFCEILFIYWICLCIHFCSHLLLKLDLVSILFRQSKSDLFQIRYFLLQRFCSTKTCLCFDKLDLLID